MTAELSSDLASYLSSSLLPIVAFPFPPPDPSTLPTPLLENQALKDLLLGRHLDEVLDHDGQRLVRHAVEGAAQSGLEGNNKMDDLEFDIESSKSRWQVTRTNSATILTAIVMPLLDNLSSSLRSLSLDKSPFVPRTAPPTLITRNSSNSLSSSARPPAPQTPVDSPRPFPTNMSIEELALLAVNAPIGLNYLSLDMEILWANERWYAAMPLFVAAVFRAPVSASLTSFALALLSTLAPKHSSSRKSMATPYVFFYFVTQVGGCWHSGRRGSQYVGRRHPPRGH